MEITFESKIAQILDHYPFLEDKLIKLNPKFKKLKNPVLRRTVARIASVRQAAFVGGMEPLELLNFLRQKVGQPPIEEEVREEKLEQAPRWIAQEPRIILDGNALLDAGKSPLAEVNRAIKASQKGEVILLLSDFRPEPLIDEMRKRGHEVYSGAEGERHYTYILV